MIGAALESVLLAIAVARNGDEDFVLKTYRGTHGRRELLNKIICNGLPPYLQQAVTTASSLLSFWRDSAAHGMATTISEFEAHDAMARLLRFAQLCNDNWPKLTAPAAGATERP
jgi:hypothetical protein